MPDSRTERIAFAVGLAAIAALAIALIPAWRSYHSSSSPLLPSLARSGGAEAERTSYRPPTAPAQKSLAAPAGVSRETPAPRKAAPAAAVAKLRLAASRGDCWLEVRASTAKGKVLYVGTLIKGKSLKLAARTFWIRFGAPQDVDLVVNGDPVSIPSGTLDVLVSRDGILAAPA